MTSEESKIINILLLGETGVGKSTVINAFANYLAYNSLSEATKVSPLYFVPAKFSLIDDNFTTKEIKIGEDLNENIEPGISSTRKIQSYLLKYNNINLRLIDTPGVGDIRGMSYDEVNTEKLLTFIGELPHLNAICILLKPNDSRVNVLFEYCLKHILTRLDKGVHTNIVFLFTNARSSFYTPGDTYLPLRMLLKQINTKDFAIPFNSSNVFCVDNESFRYIVAKSRGFIFEEDVLQEFEKSWNKSSSTSKKMLDYILSLPSVPMQGIVSVNESRRLIGRLGKSIVQLLTLCEKAILTLKNHETILKASRDSLSDLVSNLYMPVTQYKITEKTWYESRKSNGITGGVNVSSTYPFISFDLGYQQTWTDTHYTEMIVTPYVTNVEDINTKTAIVSKEGALQKMENIIQEMVDLKRKYANESNVILRAAVRFEIFLKENSILRSYDVFENYLGRLLRDETVAGANDSLIESLENIIIQYRVLKMETRNVTSKQIKDSKEELLALQYCGQSFKEILEKKFNFNDKELS